MGLMFRGIRAAAVVTCGVVLAGLGAPAATAASWHSGDTFYSSDGIVFKDSQRLLMMRSNGKKMCFTQPLGYTFVGVRAQGNTYKGILHGPQRDTAQRAWVKFERVNGQEAVTVKSRGIQPVGPEFYYRVTRADINRSQFGRQPVRTLNLACKPMAPTYP